VIELIFYFTICTFRFPLINVQVIYNILKIGIEQKLNYEKDVGHDAFRQNHLITAKIVPIVPLKTYTIIIYKVSIEIFL